MTDKLKTCPFCGGKPKFAKSGADAWVFCSNCGATQDSCKTNKEAVDNWNARATDEVKCSPSSYSCRACKSGTDEEIERIKTENARLHEALKKIIDRAEKEESKASNATYSFAYDIEDIARDALKGWKKTEQLKPCPFCGGNSHGLNYVLCKKCKSEYYPASFGDGKKAVAAWNKRSVEDKIYKKNREIGSGKQNVDWSFKSDKKNC